MVNGNRRFDHSFFSSVYLYLAMKKSHKQKGRRGNLVEDMEPTKYPTFPRNVTSREELQFYPSISDKKKKNAGKWTYAIDNEDIFGEDNLEGFMGLEVFHGMSIHSFVIV